MYKSSPYTFIFRYIFPVFMIIGSIFGIFMLWNEGTIETQAFAKSMLVNTIWISIFLVQMPLRLRSIEVNELGITFNEAGKQRLIKYSEVKWLALFDFSTPFFITIKYYDREAGESKKIAFVPNQKYQRLFSNEMNTYIKKKIKEQNPNYSKENQPSAFKNLLLIFLLATPFVLLSMYFAGDLGFVF